MVQLLSDFLSTSLADALDSARTVQIVQSEIIKLDSNTSGNYIRSLTAGLGFSLPEPAHSLDATINVDSSFIATLAGTQTLTNKTINLTNNTLSGTLGQFNAALSGASFVSTTGTETLTNKTLTSPTITQPTITGPASLTKISTFGLRDQTTTDYDTRIVSNNASPVLSANRTLTLDVNNADRTVSLTGNLTLGGSLTTSGGHATTLTTTGTTALTLPTSGTLVSKDGSGNFSAGTITATFSGNLTGNVTGQVSDISNHSTTDLSEGNNLYYTTARVDSAFDVRLATKSTSDLSEGTNLYYTTARFDSDFGDNSTSDLSEGTNKYYTAARADSDARNAISVTDNGGDGSLSYTASTGVISYTGPSATEVRAHFSAGSGITIVNGEVAFAATATVSGLIDHDQTTNFVANEHINHANVTLTAGDGLKGGGTIAASRTFHIDSAELTSLYGATIFTDLKTRDGAGSGLDADTLDGQQGSYYRIDVYNAAGTLLN